MKQIFLMVALVLVLFVQAQPPTKFYTKFGGEGDDIGYSAKQTLDGHYIIAGSTSSYGNGNTDVYLTKMDSMGQLMWSKMYGGFNNDIGKSVIQLSDSGFVVAGFTNSYGAGGYDAFLVKTDKHGNLIWQTTFGGLDWDFADDLVLGSDNHIYVVGNTSSFGSGKKDGFVLKYDLFGTLVWQKFIGGAENEELRSIIKTNDNFLATVGFTESKGEINGDGYFLKLDLNGDTLFTRTFGGGGKDFANDVVQKSYGWFMIAGAKTYLDSPYEKSLMFCFSSIGDSIWERSLLLNNENECFRSVTNSSTLYNITAFTRSIVFPQTARQCEIFTITDVDAYEYQINANGGEQEEMVYSIENTRDGGYVSVGHTTSFGSIGKDVYLIKQDSTVLTYSSIVGTKTEAATKAPSIKILTESVEVYFGDYDLKKIEILNLSGKVILSVTTDLEDVSLDTNNFLKGVYLLKITDKVGKTHSLKFVKI